MPLIGRSLPQPAPLIGNYGLAGETRMTVAVTRQELSAAELRREAVRCREAAAARRMLALASVLEGRSREAAARAAGPRAA
jgi:hypothetical protein